MAETTSWRDDFRISIIGAGPVGLATAIFLRRAGYPVTVFEREPELRAVSHQDGILTFPIPDSLTTDTDWGWHSITHYS